MQFIRNLQKYKFLIVELVSRDFKVKYKRSVLGVLWSLLNPLLTTLVMVIVFSNFFGRGMQGVSYPAYLLTGQILFNYFSEATNLSMSTMNANRNLINKVYVPKYIFPLTKCMFVGINFLLTLIPLYLVLIFTKTGICWQHLLLPYVYVCLFMFTLGMSFLLATGAVFLRDVTYLYGIVLQLWMYMTPLFWNMAILDNPLFVSIIKCNPLYQFIDFGRTIMLYHATPSLLQFVICGVLGVVMLVIGAVVFRKNQDKFIYYM